MMSGSGHFMCMQKPDVGMASLDVKAFIPCFAMVHVSTAARPFVAASRFHSAALSPELLLLLRLAWFTA